MQQTYQQQPQQEPVLFRASTSEGHLTITPSVIRMERAHGASQVMSRHMLAGARLQNQAPEWLAGGSAKLTFISQSGQRMRVRAIKPALARQAMQILGVA